MPANVPLMEGGKAVHGRVAEKLSIHVASVLPGCIG